MTVKELKELLSDLDDGFEIEVTTGKSDYYITNKHTVLKHARYVFLEIK